MEKEKVDSKLLDFDDEIGIENKFYNNICGLGHIKTLRTQLRSKKNIHEYYFF